MAPRYTLIYPISVLLLIINYSSITQVESCSFMKSDSRGSVEECEKILNDTNGGLNVTANLPLIGGAYCFNNGSGICKAFAGRYEFYYDSFKDEFLRSAPKSDYVNEYGYHERVPVSYTINGHMLYADRSINWARRFAKHELEGKNISLLSTTVINWCAFVAENYWPYKSAIKDKQYEIYFFNRQSCIIDRGNKKQPKQHFNTRFLQNSTVRVDLDMNPTIYAMQDNLANNDIRLVKHIKQHWYEVGFKVLEKPDPNIDYFVDMDSFDKKPCKICGDRPILPREAYRALSDVCMSDLTHRREDGKNAGLVQENCGNEKTEIADLPEPVYNQRPKYPLVLEVNLHNIPRNPRTAREFFGVYIENTEDWTIWAKDGLTFSAATSIPTGEKNQVRVIMLYSMFNREPGVSKFEEYNPMPYIADYVATFMPKSGKILEGTWRFDRKGVQAKNLNYVDDIAYLYKCKTLLVIFGPFYSELPLDNRIDLDTKGPVDSIYELGIWEPANAFFAMPDGSNVLWVYYRTNYIAEHNYECNKPLVKAKRIGAYMHRYGPGSPKQITIYDIPIPISEETLFQHVGAFKGDLGSVDAPDPAKYENAYIDPAKPLGEKDQTYIYIIIAVGVLLIVTMCIICMIAVRRRIKRRRQMKTIRSGNLDDGSRAEKSARSIMSWLPFTGSSNVTQRSAMSSHSPIKKRSSRLTDTVRSNRTSTPTKSAATVRSPSMNSSHTSQGSKHSQSRNRNGSQHSGSHHSLSGSRKPTPKASSSRSTGHS